MKLVIYDAEIKNAIPEKGVAPLEGVTYCRGWGDHAGMGIAVICAYVWDEGYRVYLEDNLSAFKELVEAPDTLIVGFNNRSFDDQLLEACGIHVPTNHSWDLLRAVRVARGMSPSGVSGPSLHILCQANFLAGKSGSGAFAPILWQRGKHGQVISYCLNDTIQLKKLIELVVVGRLRDPESGRVLNVQRPQPFADDTGGVKHE